MTTANTEATPATAGPGRYLVLEKKTNRVLDHRLPDEVDFPRPKNSIVVPVGPGGWRRSAADMQIAEAWPAEEA